MIADIEAEMTTTEEAETDTEAVETATQIGGVGLKNPDMVSIHTHRFIFNFPHRSRSWKR